MSIVPLENLCLWKFLHFNCPFAT